MIRALVGDLFQSEAQTLVNTVNCVGIMGKGIALSFKERYPDMYRDYVERCDRKEVHLGQPYIYRGLFPPNIINFPTKDHWRSVSKLSDIEAGLDYLEQHYREWGVTSLAVPPLGCGQGQLEWRVVGPTLWRHLDRLDIPVELYAPTGTPSAELDASFLGQRSDALTQPGSHEPLRIDPAWVALVEIVVRVGRDLYHWPIGRTRFQKLAYFATALGLPTHLDFKRSSFGPFAPHVTALITRLVNNGLLREEPRGKMLLLTPGPTYNDAIQAEPYRKALQQWREQIDRVVDLLQRVSTRDTEIVATVHYVWMELSQNGQRQVSERNVLEEVIRWKQRRSPAFDDATVLQTIRNLHILRWIDVARDAGELSPDEELMLLA